MLHILNKAGDHFDLDPAEFEEVDAALALLRAALDEADERAAAEPEAKNGPPPCLARIDGEPCVPVHDENGARCFDCGRSMP